MPRNKHKIRALCGLSLLVVGFPQLPIEFSGGLHAIFSFSWLCLVMLAISANWRRMQRFDLLLRHREEARRREQWLKAERQWRNVHGRSKSEQRRVYQSV